jgi:hypothetical protein
MMTRMASLLLILTVVFRVVVSSQKQYNITASTQEANLNGRSYKNILFHFFLILQYIKERYIKSFLSDTVVGNVASMDQPRPNEG